MIITAFSDASKFLSIAEPFLLKDEAMHCLGLGIISGLGQSEGHENALLAVHDEESTVGIAWMTPPYPLGLSLMPLAAVKALVDYLDPLAPKVSGVVGPKDVAKEFCDIFTERHRCSIQSKMEQRIFQAKYIQCPFAVTGFMRVVQEGELDLLSEWIYHYAVDCKLPADRNEARKTAELSVKLQNRYFWIVDDQPVAMANFSGKTPNGIRVSGVYTPPKFRRKGYASALVAGLSQKLLNEGSEFCFLYTDLANPTSNNIYQKIGYEPVGDSTYVMFQRS